MEEDLLALIKERQLVIMKYVEEMREDLSVHIKDDVKSLGTLYDKINSINVDSAGQFGKIKGIGLVLAIAIPIATTILVTVITHLLNHMK